MNLIQGLPVYGSFYIGNQGERKWAFIRQIHGVLGSGNHKGNRTKPLLSWGLHTMAGQQARGRIPADGMPARWWQAIWRKGRKQGGHGFNVGKSGFWFHQRLLGRVTWAGLDGGGEYPGVWGRIIRAEWAASAKVLRPQVWGSCGWQGWSGAKRMGGSQILSTRTLAFTPDKGLKQRKVPNLLEGAASGEKRFGDMKVKAGALKDSNNRTCDFDQGVPGGGQILEKWKALRRQLLGQSCLPVIVLPNAYSSTWRYWVICIS